MFLASKFLSFLTQPLAWVACLMTLGMVLARRRPAVARRLNVAALGLLLVLGWEPLPNAALRYKPADAGEKAKENGPNSASTATGAPGAGSGAGNGAGKPGKKRDSQSGTVYVLAGDEIKPVSVQIGITDNRNTELISGELKAGDRVITGENTVANKKPSSVGMRMF